MQHDAILWDLCPPSVHPETKMSTPKWTLFFHAVSTFLQTSASATFYATTTEYVEGPASGIFENVSKTLLIPCLLAATSTFPS